MFFVKKEPVDSAQKEPFADNELQDKKSEGSKRNRHCHFQKARQIHKFPTVQQHNNNHKMSERPDQASTTQAVTIKSSEQLGSSQQSPGSGQDLVNNSKNVMIGHQRSRFVSVIEGTKDLSISEEKHRSPKHNNNQKPASSSSGVNGERSFKCRFMHWDHGGEGVI